MANLTDTQILAAITKVSIVLQNQTEFRDFKHSTVHALLAGENDVFKELKRMKKSDEQLTSVDINKRIYTASGTAKSATHAAAAFADSIKKDITYSRKTQTFKVSHKQADNNRFEYERILMTELKNKLMSLYLDLSTAQIAWLNTNRTQVVQAGGLQTFDGVNFKYDNVVGDKDVFFDYLKTSMGTNKYVPSYEVVGDARIAALHRKLASNGRTNSDNTEFQLPGINMIEELQLAATAGGTAFAWQKGLVGMTTWNEPLNRRGEGKIGDNQGLFTMMIDPAFGFNLDMHIKRGVVDTSGAGGNLQDVVDEYEIAITYATEGSWTSVTDESHIIKITQGV